MKSIGNVWDKIIDLDNLRLAYFKARRGKRNKREVIRYSYDLDNNLTKLHEALKNETWLSHHFNEFYVRNEVKLRFIQAPSFEDRIVHHAIMNILQNVFVKELIPDTYACIKGRGNHRAVLKVKEFAGSYNPNATYILQIDIHKFFPSVNREILYKRLSKKFREKKLLNLFYELIMPKWDIKNKISGIPIGSLTSQVFANFYLNPLDHYIKDILRIKHYVRYMDDLVLFFKSKEDAWDCFDKIKEFVETKLDLKLNPKSRIYKLKQGIDFSGYRVFKNKVMYRKRNVKSAQIRFKKVKINMNNINLDKQLNKIRQQVSSFLSYMTLNSLNYFEYIKKKVLKPIINLKVVYSLYESFKLKWYFTCRSKLQ